PSANSLRRGRSATIGSAAQRLGPRLPSIVGTASARPQRPGRRVSSGSARFSGREDGDDSATTLSGAGDRGGSADDRGVRPERRLVAVRGRPASPRRRRGDPPTRFPYASERSSLWLVTPPPGAGGLSLGSPGSDWSLSEPVSVLPFRRT